MTEEPIVEFRRIVGFHPAFMPCVWIHCEMNVGPAGFERVDHFLRSLQWHNEISGPMKHPGGQMANPGYLAGFPAAAHGGNGGETMWIHHRQIPGSKAAHAQSGDVDPI